MILTKNQNRKNIRTTAPGLNAGPGTKKAPLLEESSCDTCSNSNDSSGPGC